MKTIAGFFRTQAEGQRAHEALREGGFSPSEVSFLAGDAGRQESPKVGPVIEDAGSESEAGSDAFIGGATGAAAGALAAALPVAALIAMGPLGLAIGGLAAGAAVGGIIGLLKDHGISEEEAEFYAEGVSRGGALVTVHDLDEKREEAARKILDDSGAVDTEELADEFERAGKQGGA